MSGKYPVITLCGSTRFKDQFLEAQKRLTLEGNIVISVGLFGHSGDDEVLTEGTKEMLDDMHKRKIDMADEIFVINVGGYIGSSTRSEIEYAKSHGKGIRYLEEGAEGFISPATQGRTMSFPPLLCDAPRILIIGALPGAESLAHQQYYYSKSNRLWAVLCHLTDEPMPMDYTKKKALLAKYHIVLWDYYESAIRPDSSNDKDIRDGYPNDIPAFLAAHPTIKTIAINGFGKYREFGHKISRKLASMPSYADIRVLRLPETSGTNKNYGWGSVDNLCREWAQIFD